MSRRARYDIYSLGSDATVTCKWAKPCTVSHAVVSNVQKAVFEMSKSDPACAKKAIETMEPIQAEDQFGIEVGLRGSFFRAFTTCIEKKARSDEQNTAGPAYR